MGRSSQKGSKFEREICKELSRWWSNGKRDDIFWRTSGSGARAKSRSKSNQQTFGQYGDVQATDPSGQPLIDLCTIELKKGYAAATLHDLIDRQDRHRPPFEKFIFQAMTDRDNAGTPYWMLITKRDQRVPIITIPRKFYSDLWNECGIPRLSPSVFSRFDMFGPSSKLFTTTLEEFLCEVTPTDIKTVHGLHI